MGTYLGISEKIHESKSQVFAFVQNCQKSRIDTWSAKFLSKGGEKLLVKSVAHVFQTYVMSRFLIPNNILSNLSSAILKFLWSTRQESKKSIGFFRINYAPQSKMEV